MDMKAYIEEAESVLLHTYNRFQIVLDKGEGVHLYDANGKEYLTNSTLNLSAYFGKNIVLPHAHYFNDNDIITLDANPDIKLQIIHTPGHTSDSVIFYHKSENLAFVGDTIFKGSVGRTDFPGGDQKQLKNSILKKILTLPEQTTLYSGHSEPTNVASEKNNFVFFF